MKLLDLFRNRGRRVRRRDDSDPTADWTPRDWADLPVHHPRTDDGAR